VSVTSVEFHIARRIRPRLMYVQFRSSVIGIGTAVSRPMTSGLLPHGCHEVRPQVRPLHRHREDHGFPKGFDAGREVIPGPTMGVESFKSLRVSRLKWSLVRRTSLTSRRRSTARCGHERSYSGKQAMVYSSLQGKRFVSVRETTIFCVRVNKMH
jgi:hypothetical protein